MKQSTWSAIKRALLVVAIVWSLACAAFGIAVAGRTWDPLLDATMTVCIAEEADPRQECLREWAEIQEHKRDDVVTNSSMGLVFGGVSAGLVFLLVRWILRPLRGEPR